MLSNLPPELKLDSPNHRKECELVGVTIVQRRGLGGWGVGGRHTWQFPSCSTSYDPPQSKDSDSFFLRNNFLWVMTQTQCCYCAQQIKADSKLPVSALETVGVRHVKGNDGNKTQLFLICFGLKHRCGFVGRTENLCDVWSSFHQSQSEQRELIAKDTPVCCVDTHQTVSAL